MKMSPSIVIFYFFLCQVTARKYVWEYTKEDVIREVDTTGTIFGGEAENKLPSDNTEKNYKRYPFATGLVPYGCLECICKLESKCKAIGCKMDVGSLSCGYFQIKQAYWIDCGRLGGDWKTCANNATCASECVQRYMARYVKGTGCSRSCETYAREHNGGPKGCKNKSTLKYWEKLKKISGCGKMDV